MGCYLTYSLQFIFWPSQIFSVGMWRWELNEARAMKECLLSGISQFAFFHHQDYFVLLPTVPCVLPYQPSIKKLKSPTDLPVDQSDGSNPQFTLPLLDHSRLCQVNRKLTGTIDPLSIWHTNTSPLNYGIPCFVCFPISHANINITI